MKYATVTGLVSWSGGKTVLAKGKTTAEDDHPLVRERPDLWTDDLPGAQLQVPNRRLVDDGEVERATRAPGEKRRGGRPKLPRDADGNIVRE